jgi:hypothetical protein
VGGGCPAGEWSYSFFALSADLPTDFKCALQLIKARRGVFEDDQIVSLWRIDSTIDSTKSGPTRFLAVVVWTSLSILEWNRHE